MPKINLEFYKNQDNNTYFPLNNLDENIIELLKNPVNDIKVRDSRPEIYYYLLSPHIEDLFKWFDINPNSEILEMHSGLGASTKTLCQKAKNVTTVNFSKTNAKIIEQRLKNCENLEIIVGNIKEIEFKKKFDYIILTDVIEFSRAFFHEIDFIKFFKNLLNEDGTIILTTTNKYAIENFSGAINHISAKPFDFVNNFPEVPFLKSFSKKELTKTFTEAGFKNINFYYPVPNHYINAQILSDKYIESMAGRKVATKYRNYVINQNNTIDEINAIKDLVQEDMFSFFANSYIVFATDSKLNVPCYAQFKGDILTVLNENCCTKKALNKEAKEILFKMKEFYETETKRIENQNIQNVKYAKCELKDDSLIFEYAKGTPLNKIALDLKDDYYKLLTFLTEFKEFIYKLYPDIQYSDFKVESLVLENTGCIKNANIDLNLGNIFKDNDFYTIIDYDKTSELVPINYLIASAIFVLTVDSGFEIDDFKLLKDLGLSEREIKIYQLMYAKNIRG